MHGSAADCSAWMEDIFLYSCKSFCTVHACILWEQSSFLSLALYIAAWFFDSRVCSSTTSRQPDSVIRYASAYIVSQSNLMSVTDTLGTALLPWAFKSPGHLHTLLIYHFKVFKKLWANPNLTQKQRIYLQSLAPHTPPQNPPHTHMLHPNNPAPHHSTRSPPY